MNEIKKVSPTSPIEKYQEQKVQKKQKEYDPPQHMVITQVHFVNGQVRLVVENLSDNTSGEMYQLCLNADEIYGLIQNSKHTRTPGKGKSYQLPLNAHNIDVIV